MIKLYHYSNQDFKNKISPIYFGKNTFTGNSQRISGVKRSYFYLQSGQREHYFYGSKYCYTVKISEKKLYNLDKDPLKLADKLKGKDIFSYFKAKGYKGIIGDNGFKSAVLFYPTKIKARKDLIKV